MSGEIQNRESNAEADLGEAIAKKGTRLCISWLKHIH